ncbi:hypothetical protein [Aliiruegeria sabulilitoris]|uniref:hypothetical protein n=1 Tax=Aliiruegeria sabulilitoris TaxID=1510458 RepID=UPI0008377AAF|nr:hypothetical protein [Aliiruegeria sabulilitoris]NDR57914.1 hypothetical protein [Pseudoruegeria sp. M32A2M]
MKPIQLWLPMIMGGAGRPTRQRDIQRLHAVWDGHDVLWTKPSWSGPEAWAQDRMKVGCISGEEIECFRILHIGDGGGIVGPAAAGFGDLKIDGLLDAWLGSEVQAVPSTAGTPFEISVPTVVEGGVTYLRETFASETGGHHPFRVLEQDENTAAAQWPPGDHDPRPISPQSEALAREPSDTDGTVALCLRWAGLLTSVMPSYTSEDDLFAQAQMRSIRDLARNDVEQARHSAEVAARNWVVDGQSSVNAAWLKPIIAAEGEDGALVAIYSRFDLDCGCLAEAYENPRLRRELRKPMGVRRVLGVPGLAWALMLDRLSEGQAERLCERCGQPISGRTNKRFCGETDNPDCFKARRSGDRRRSRKGSPQSGK